MEAKPDPQQLLANTLRRLQQNPEQISPVDEMINQWSETLGEGNLTLENVADELFSLKRALDENEAPRIASSLNTLSKLTKQAANESSEVELVGQLLQLAQLLDELSDRVAEAK